MEDGQKVVAVLLVPHEGDPLGLLKDGKCGARPPQTWVGRDYSGKWGPTIDQAARHPHRWGAGLKRARRALVLAWDGEVVPEGLDRWWRLASLGMGYSHPSVWESLAEVVQLAHDERDRGGVWLLLDAEGREVTDE